MKKFVFLQGIGKINEITLIKLRKNLDWSLRTFEIKTKILPNRLVLKRSEFHPLKRQYNADLILNRISKQKKDEEVYKVLGILDQDIYAKTLNFVFGKANGINSREALISVARLDEKFYRRSDNPSLFEFRVLKEAMHELGHTFGLYHCSNECVMEFSNSIDEADKKPIKFCKSCLHQLHNIFDRDD